MIGYPMNVTDCYECGYFRAGGHFTCQKHPQPYYVDHPTDGPIARYSVPCPVDWLHRTEMTVIAIPSRNISKNIPDQALVNELRQRGYDVTCTKTIAL